MKQFITLCALLTVFAASASAQLYTLTFNDPVTQTCNWTVDKTATPELASLFTGDLQEVQWEVSVTFDSLNFSLNGTLTVNSGSTIRNNKKLYICLRKNGVNEGSCLNPTWVNLASGNSYQHVYPYSFAGPYVKGGDTWSVFAEVRASNNTTVEQTSTHALAPYFEACSSTVTDHRYAGQDTWTATESDSSWTYEETFGCSGDAGTVVNVATLEAETDTARFALSCYDLEVKKTVSASFDREYDWDIAKFGDQTEILLNTDTQSLDVNYDVAVDTVGHTDSNWLVEGMIEVINPAPIAASLAGVIDKLDGSLEAPVACEDGGAVSFPHSVAAGDTLRCTYSVSPPDGSNQQNAATATLKNYSFAFGGGSSDNGTTDFEDSKAVTYSATLIDECTNVDDTLWDGNEVPVVSDQQACVQDELPMKWDYAYTIGPYTAFCGDSVFANLATQIEDSTDESTSGGWDVDVTADCEIDCVLSFGYWKNHSSYGHASYRDVNWDSVGGEDTAFFLSGQTYHQVLLTAPRKGNAYYILAHQYIPAELNFATGAAAPADVQDAFDDATTLFNTYTPAQVAGFKGKTGKEIRDMFISAAKILDQYNTGFCADNPGVDGCPADTSGYPAECTEDASSQSISKAPNSSGSLEATDAQAVESSEETPTEYALDANYPNPFNPSTTITFQLPESSSVRLSVFDIQGREVALLADGTRPAGTHKVQFDAKDLPSGLYLYRLAAGGKEFRKTMLLLK